MPSVNYAATAKSGVKVFNKVSLYFTNTLKRTILPHKGGILLQHKPEEAAE
jgi:hypothetical protein